MLLAFTLAFAQHVDIDATAVLTTDDLPWEASSVGHPAIWETRIGLSMIFESVIDGPGCDVAYALGRATSTDGITWTVRSTTIGPSAAAPCGYRAPVVADTVDGLLLLARAVHDDAVWARRWHQGRSSGWRVPSLDGLETFSVARRDGTWFGVGVDPSVGLVTLSSEDAATWTVDSTSMVYGTTWWSLDGLLSPSVSCFDTPAMPWVMHYGGWTGGDTGFTWGLSDDLGIWFLSLAAEIWTPSDAWTSWDAIASPSDAWVVFEQDGAIGWATTSGGMPVDTATRDCHTTP